MALIFIQMPKGTKRCTGIPSSISSLSHTFVHLADHDTTAGAAHDAVSDPTQHADYLECDTALYSLDGDIVLAAGNTTFRVHELVLSRHSTVCATALQRFRAEYAAKPADVREVLDDCPVLRVPDIAYDLKQLVLVMHDGGVNKAGPTLAMPFSLRTMPANKALNNFKPSSPLSLAWLTNMKDSRREIVMDHVAGSAENPLTSIHRDSQVWFEGGNIVVVANNTAFRFHKSVLSRYSDVFRDLFCVPQPAVAGQEELMDGCTVVHVSDTSHDFRVLVLAMYGGVK
ncbi:hypothetical protein C8Q74DRAFT_1367104 [Fomes fomentarius]|nr:hypothetical protein C8Q74DRAFT_1367104 [Fomes fomentarius]